jgi:hypothetical protein
MMGSVEFRMLSILDFAFYCSLDRYSRLLIARAAASSSVMAIVRDLCDFMTWCPHYHELFMSPLSRMDASLYCRILHVDPWMSMSSTWRIWASMLKLCH